MFNLTKSLIELQGKEKLQHHQAYEIGSSSQSRATGGCSGGKGHKMHIFHLKTFFIQSFLYTILF